MELKATVCHILREAHVLEDALALLENFLIQFHLLAISLFFCKQYTYLIYFHYFWKNEI